MGNGPSVSLATLAVPLASLAEGGHGEKLNTNDWAHFDEWAVSTAIFFI